jgi:pimeloyl-ACP methyl ester carboxylesterase
MRRIHFQFGRVKVFGLSQLLSGLILLLTTSQSLWCQYVNSHQKAQGNWISSVDYFRFAIHVTENGFNSLDGHIDFPNEEAWDIPVDINLSDSCRIHFDIYNIRCGYVGTINDSGDTIEGNFIDPYGGETPVNLVRTNSPPVRTSKRPQEPVKPYPYYSEEVIFVNRYDSIKLRGTLTLPDATGPFRAVVLLSGSGPNDRDQLIWGHRVFLVLADYLTRQGIAVLRYDDRGAGRSEGNHDEASFEDFAMDALAAQEYLGARPEIDHDQIGLIGHSEGAAIAPIAASKSDDVSFIVLMAAPGYDAIDGNETGLNSPFKGLISQFENGYRNGGASEEAITFKCMLLSQMFSIAREEPDKNSARKKIGELLKSEEPSLLELSEEDRKKIELESVEAYDFEWMLSTGFLNVLRYDPQTFLSKVRCPVLALHGTKDLQIPIDNLTGIELSLQLGGNNDFTIERMEGLNHLFQTAVTGQESEYSKIEETIAPQALALISEWIKK